MASYPHKGVLPATPRHIFAWFNDVAGQGLEHTQGNICTCDALEFAQGEGLLDTIHSANQKTPEPRGGKKLYETPPLGFESAFNVSALSYGKIFSNQRSCKASMKTW
jgi:hypothetical protein